MVIYSKSILVPCIYDLFFDVGNLYISFDDLIRNTLLSIADLS